MENIFQSCTTRTTSNNWQFWMVLWCLPSSIRPSLVGQTFQRRSDRPVYLQTYGVKCIHDCDQNTSANRDWCTFVLSDPICISIPISTEINDPICPGFDCLEQCLSNIRTLSRALSSIFQHCPEHRRPTMLGTIFASIVDNVRTLLWRSLFQTQLAPIARFHR